MPTEQEDAILELDYEPTQEWGGSATTGPQKAELSVRELSVRLRLMAAPLREAELNRRASDRIIDVLQGVSREFIHIDLGI